MGTGGMRYGAGRPSWHVKAEHCLRLNIQDLMRRNLLGGGYFTWRWSNSYTGEEVGSIGIMTTADSARLSFNSVGTPVTQEVRITRTPCHFGGSRPWFRCPRCWRRVGVLFLRSSNFMCRHCGRVAYASQSEDAIGRGWRLQHRLEAKLGEHWSRPKHMRQKTRDRLVSRIIELERRRDDALAAFMVRRFPGLLPW